MYSRQDLDGIDLMIKRLLKKDTEQYVKKFEYNWVALQKELDSRQRMTSGVNRPVNDKPKQRSSTRNSHHKLHPQAPPTHSSTDAGYSSLTSSQKKFPHKYQPPNHAIDSSHLFNGISSTPTSSPATYSHANLNSGLLNTVHDHHNLKNTHPSLATPPIITRESHGPSPVDTPPIFQGGISNYQQDFNIAGQNASPYFNSSEQYSNDVNGSSLHTDVYNGLPETFV